ncbi:MAG: hypothetical protein AMJ90_01390 [candidate division Zixibacteria bacterium SM23_73_2]|nr:MAG: hypothetical protein AMJ90_01390 [candidate division Zixibacteria bacterium SM23_73_2]
MKKAKFTLFFLSLGLMFAFYGNVYPQSESIPTTQKGFLEQSKLDVAFGIGSFSNKVFQGQTNNVPQMDMQSVFRYEPKIFEAYLKLKFGLYKLGPAKTDGQYWDEHSNFLKLGPGISKKIHFSKDMIFRPFVEGNYSLLAGAKKDRDESNVISDVFDTSYSDFAPEFGFTLFLSRAVDLSYSYRAGDEPFHYVSFRHSPLFRDGLTPKVYYEFYTGDKHKAFYAGVWWPVPLKGGARDYNLKKDRLVKQNFWSKSSFHLYMGEIVVFTVGSFVFLALMGASWA